MLSSPSNLIRLTSHLPGKSLFRSVPISTSTATSRRFPTEVLYRSRSQPLHTSSIMSERIKLAKASDLPEPGKMKAFDAFGQGDEALQILLSNVKGKIFATSAKCTHYGAPLANGVLTADGRLVCPWHGACFHAKTGDIEDAPALDSLLSFPVEFDDNGDAFVEADKKQLEGKPGKPVSCSGSIKEGKGLVIVGGGSVAINVVESARKTGYTGSITILSSEPHAPLDRTKLSKGLVGDADALIWRSPAHLKNVLKAESRHSATVTALDLDNSSVKLQSGESVPYEYLVLATGGAAKRLPVPGAKEGELKGVHLIRSVSDVSGLLGSLGDKADKDVVVIGSSFIGLESAIAMAGQKKAKSVSVVGMEGVPLENILGAEVGKGIQDAQSKNNGIKFYMKAGVESIEGSSGKVSAVKIKDSNGKAVELKADIVLLGVGVSPATGFLKETSGFPQLEKDGSVLVDSTMRVQNLPKNANNVFAAGDIATFPAFNGKDKIRIEHWNVAGNQGRAIGATLGQSGKDTEYKKLPIFWSAMGAQLRYVSDGIPGTKDQEYVDGNVAEGKFVAYYGREGKIAAVASMGRDPIMVHSAELMKIGKMPSLEEVKGGKDPLSIPLSDDAKSQL